VLQGGRFSGGVLLPAITADRFADYNMNEETPGDPPQMESSESPSPEGGGEHIARAHSMRALMIGAIGVIYGDIGTSPLYAIRQAFTGSHPMAVDEINVLGLLSLVFWALILVVTLKYTMLMTMADNQGQGGSLALLARLNQVLKGNRRTWFAPLIVVLGVTAGALFYGDSMITPAISVLSAVEGLNVAVPGLGRYVIPLTIVILVSLFLLQSRGTEKVGRLFGPIMIVWFITLAIIGVINIVQTPAILVALNPWYAVQFFMLHTMAAFLSLSAVILVVTGGEALYADMGHFGREPVKRSWIRFVLPGLTLNYFGQGALLLRSPEAVSSPFYRMVPEWATLPMVGLATVATVIASQAVITGSFSVTRQAMQLGFLPRMATVHTSETESGQIYIPFVNWMLLFVVILLVLGFQTSNNLASAYGVALSMTMLIDTILVAVAMILMWKWKAWIAGMITIVLLVVDMAFVASNATKVPSGGWVPVAIGGAILLLLMTWKKGRKLLFNRMAAEAMPMEMFLESLSPSVTRVPGTAIFMSGTTEGVPHAMLHNLKHNKVVHERVVFLTVVTEEVPHVLDEDRIEVHHLSRRFYRMQMRYGYMDETNVPADLEALAPSNFEINNMEISYFLGRETLIPSRRPGMALWREGLFAWMSRSATSAMDFFKLPADRVVEVGTQVEI
jgi:KUP system potassium uptake protein